MQVIGTTPIARLDLLQESQLSDLGRDGAIVSVSLVLVRSRGRNAPMPFGPLLAGAGFTGLFWGERIADLWFRIAM